MKIDVIPFTVFLLLIIELLYSEPISGYIEEIENKLTKRIQRTIADRNSAHAHLVRLKLDHYNLIHKMLLTKL